MQNLLFQPAYKNIHGILMDNVLCRLSETILDTISGILIRTFSDHQPYFTILNNINVKIHNLNILLPHITIPLGYSTSITTVK